jgi:central glycolytic genes regulator
MKQDFLEIFQKIAPDLMGTIKERYLLLRHISDAEPVGRRTLAGISGLSERVVRAHVDVLRRSGIVRFTTMGIALEPEGKAMMPDLLECFLRMNRLDEMQQYIRQQLRLKDVFIIPGDCDTDKTAQEELSRRGALLLADLLDSVKIVAISGGSTMAGVAATLPESTAGVTIVPARGGIGNRVEYQANVIAASIAAKVMGSYHMLHIPDGMSEAALRVMLRNDVQTKKIVAMAKSAQVILFGIGRADTMADRRDLSPQEHQALTDVGACGEALGSYCDLAGNVVHATNNVGISLRELHQNLHVIAVAGGASKSKAIVSVMRACHTGILVTDEAAATEIVKMI